MPFSTGDNNWGQPGKWYVHPTAGLGTHTTIAAAYASSSAKDTIYLFPNVTYVENLTITTSISIVTVPSPTINNGANINGLITISGNPVINFTNINFARGSGSNFSISATTSQIKLSNCTFTSQSNDIMLTHSGSAPLLFNNCNFLSNNSGASIFNLTGSAIVSFEYCTDYGSTGLQTASTISSGNLILHYCHLNNPITSSSTASITIEKCIAEGLTNILYLTCGGSGVNSISNSFINSGTAPSISIGTGSTLAVSQLTINSTNTNPITGLGTLNYSEIQQVSGTPGTFNTSTINALETDIGTLILKTPLAALQGGTGASNSSTSTGTILRSNGTNFVPTTTTYPTTTTANQILYSSATSVISEITAAANGVLISNNSSVPSMLANGTVGQVLTANSSAPPSWQNQAATANQIVNLVDDFIGFTTNTNANTFSNIAWTQSATGTFQTSAATNTFNGHPGVITHIALTSANAGIIAQQGAATANTIVLGGGILTINWIFNIVAASSSSNRYTLDFGLSDSLSTTAPANGCWIAYSDNLNSGNWTFNTSAASTPTNSNSSTAASTGWHNAQIVVNAAASSVQFNMDGVSLGTAITTHIPTIAVSPWFNITWSVGTIAIGSVLIDLMYLQQNLTTAR